MVSMAADPENSESLGVDVLEICCMGGSLDRRSRNQL